MRNIITVLLCISHSACWTVKVQLSQ